jgi:hypothetical protein
MRTWLHVLPPEHHAPEASFGLAHRRGQPDAQKRVPVPVMPGAPYALAKETGCPEGKSARRTAWPLA